MNLSAYQRQFGEQDNYDLALGSVFGARWWALESRTGLLRGQWNSVWKAGENVAACRSPSQSSTAMSFRAWAKGQGPTVLPDSLPEDEQTPHEPPGEDCACGIYAFWKPEPLPIGGLAPVLGVVEGYGRTLVGDRGFRCEKARIVALHIPELPGMDLALLAAVEQALEDRYVVPVYTTERLMLMKHPLTTDYTPQM